MSNAFTRVVHDDTAENSIMQTITIAVSAILIAAGLVTAPGLINNARDNNATTDLANSAYAEESLLASDGKYWVYDNFNASQYRQMEKPGIDGAVNFLPSARSRLIVETTDSGKKWVATSYSTSGKVFARSSESAKTVQLTDENFSSFSSVLAGEEIVLADASANSSGLIIPEGITVATVGNMYEASVEEEPYDFSRAATRSPNLPGEGVPSTGSTTPTNPAPVNPAPAPAAVPSGPTSFNASNFEMAFQGPTSANIKFDDASYDQDWFKQTYFKTGVKTDTTKSFTSYQGPIDKATTWTFENVKMNLTDFDGKNVTASSVGDFKFTEYTVGSNTFVYAEVTDVQFASAADRESMQWNAYSFVINIDGYDFAYQVEAL